MRKNKNSARRKIYPGEFADDPTYAEMVVMLTRVHDHPALGTKKILDILDRVPSQMVSQIKQNEYGRVIRMCADALDSVLD